MPTPDSAGSPPPKSHRRLRRLFWIVVRVYLVLCLLLYLGQDWIAFPGSSDQGTPLTRINYGGDAQVLHLTTRTGIPIAAVFGASGDPHSPTILYFYGNGGCVAYSRGEFDHLRQLGVNVLIPDLPGYGESGGRPSEANFYSAADAAWNDLQSRSDIDKSKIIAMGWSMGAGVAIDLASRKPVAGLATFNAFTTLPAMARKQVPWAPTGLLLKYRFDNQSKIAGIHCPMFICNGRLDTLVPPVMSDDLARLAGGPVTRLVIDTADHNSIFAAEPAVVWGALGKWIASINRARFTPMPGS